MDVSFRSVTPLIPSGGPLGESLDFYTECLGFRIVWRSETMAGIVRDGVAFNVVENDERGWADQASFSIGVTGLEALYEEVRYTPARVGPLEMKPWGRREVHVIVPSGVCLQFFEVVED